MTLVKSVIKAFDILELIANSINSSTIVQIAANLKLNRTTTYHLVQTLESKGYLIRGENTNNYQIGFGVLPLAGKLLDSNRLRIEALPYLDDLAKNCGERVNLGILVDGEVLYLGGVEKPSLPVVYTRFGKKAPAHCCSLGKIILAHLSNEEVDRIFQKRPLIKMTETTITDLRLLKQHLAEICSQGYAIDNAEHMPQSYCISVLLRDSTGKGIGSISISSGDLQSAKGYLGNLQQTAEIISHKMGYTLR